MGAKSGMNFNLFNPADIYAHQLAGFVVFMPLLILFGITGCAHVSETLNTDNVFYDFEIVNTYPHDPGAFTQGLLFLDGYLYESTGLRGRSSVRKVELETGKIIKKHELDSEYFGEGLTELDGRLIQLTLDAGIGFVYDVQTFRKKHTFQYSGRGWGLTNDGERLIMSDGTAYLRFFDPDTYRETDRLAVTERGVPVKNLNELQMVSGKIYANVLFTNHIAIINPETGQIEGRIDLGKLLPLARNAGSPINVLNGIAYDATNDRLFVTGKLWPVLFEIRLLYECDSG
jgi:glutaminyl-peptide cyclotransferase